MKERALVLLGLVVIVVGATSCAGHQPVAAPRTVAGSEGGAGGALSDMVWIAGGMCQRGDSSGAGYRDEHPVREIELRGFFIARTEVTWELWQITYNWAIANGYSFDDTYDFHPERSLSHPLCFVSWYDAVKWCNARSEREDRTPVYRADELQQTIYRTGQLDLTEAMVVWEANGYRLPTELEWEWAARGGMVGQHYPWPSAGPDFERHLDGTRANYWDSGDPWESNADCATAPVAYFDGKQVPAGNDQVNGYGLYDMTGNVSEWCWDWYLDTWYTEESSGLSNTRGPVSGYGRVLRGGSWISSPKYCRVSARYMSAPDYRCHCYGFRCVVGTTL